MAKGRIGPFEEELLRILMLHPTDAYGVRIHSLLEAATGRKISFGALYTTLDRLEAKGLVTSWWGEPTAERGGRRKRYFKIQASGVFALNRSDVPTAAPVTRLAPQEARP